MGQNQTVPKRYPKGTRLVIAGEWMILPHDLWKSEAPAPQKALRAPWQHPIWAEQKLKRPNTKAWFGMGYQYVSIPHRDRMSHKGNRPFAIFRWIYGFRDKCTGVMAVTDLTDVTETKIFRTAMVSGLFWMPFQISGSLLRQRLDIRWWSLMILDDPQAPAAQLSPAPVVAAPPPCWGAQSPMRSCGMSDKTVHDWITSYYIQ